MSADAAAAGQPASKGLGPWLAGLLVLALVGAGLYARFGGEDAPELTLAQRYEADPRLVPLIYDCPFGRPFDADTSDLVPVMVSKLDRGQRAPLRLFKQELAALGEDAVPELRRLFDDAYSDTWRVGVVENVLAVCALMDGLQGLEMSRLGLEHPSKNVRLAALDGVAQHGGPEDYDRVRPWLDRTSSEQEQGDYMRTLILLDSPRFYTEFVGFLKEGRYKNAWLLVATRLHLVNDKQTIAALAEQGVRMDMPNQIVPFLLAPLARQGDQATLELLRERLESEIPTRVQFTLEALRRNELGHEASRTLIHDERANLRKLAAEILAEQQDSEEVRGWLHQGLSDPDANVRTVCLARLIELGDELAEGQAVALLAGGPVERQRAVEALTGQLNSTPFSGAEGSVRIDDRYALGLAEEPTGPDSVAWNGDAALASRCLEVLTAEYAQAGDRATRISVLKALARVPMGAAGEFLLACEDDFEQPISQLTPARWLTGQVFNTGPEGRAVLRARLPLEQEPFRRLDLIEFIWQDHSAAGRELLLEVLADPATNEYERLFVADRLTRMRASARVAPRIKQAYLQCTHAVTRSALQCLLWSWYGQHDPL